MSFLGNLAKGFVRSTVNQVGRDTGRVISNKIYGDKHSTPVRGIIYSDGNYYNKDSNELISSEEFNHKLNEDGYKIQHFTSNPFVKAFLWCMGLIATIFINIYEGGYWIFLAPGMLSIMGTLKLLASFKTMTIYKNTNVGMYKTDMRHKEGKKYVGDTQQEIEYEVMPTKSYKIDMIIICIVYILLAIYMYISANESINNYTHWLKPCLIALIVILSLHVFMKLRQKIR